MLQSWQPNTQTVLVSNPNYWATSSAGVSVVAA
jgi:hypothetical protein